MSPGAPIRPRVSRDSDVDERFARREIPARLDDLDGDLEILPTKSEDVQGPTDVWEVRTAGSPGYGDPLERDPERVAEDVRRGLVSREAATDVYGVELAGAGTDVTVRELATEEHRAELRERRLANSVIPAEVA